MKTELVNYTPPDTAIRAMSKCYGKNCTIDSLVGACKSGHWSLLEHIMVTFDVECSQKVLAQIERHRHKSMTVQSTRGMDISVNGFYDDFAGLNSKQKFMLVSAYGAAAMQYNNLLALGVPQETAAYVLPLGTNVKLTLTANLREWMEYLKKRLCKRASNEHQKLAIELFEKLNYIYPRLCNLEMLGMCSNCKELSCDFTSHKKEPKKPVVLELKEKENGK